MLEFGTPAILKIEAIGSLGSSGVPGIQGLPRTFDIIGGSWQSCESRSPIGYLLPDLFSTMVNEQLT